MRVCLLVQGTWVRTLVWEDPTCRGAARPREPQLLSLCVWSLCSATREATIVRGPRTAMKSGPRLPQQQKALAQKRRPNIAINQSINQIFKKKKKKKLSDDFQSQPSTFPAETPDIMEQRPAIPSCALSEFMIHRNKRK